MSNGGGEVICSCCKQVLLLDCVPISANQRKGMFDTSRGIEYLYLALCKTCYFNQSKLTSFLFNHCELAPKSQFNALKKCMFFQSKDDQLTLKTFINKKSAIIIRDQTNYLNSIQNVIPKMKEFVDGTRKNIKEKLENAICEIIKAQVPVLLQAIEACLADTKKKKEQVEQKGELFKKTLLESKMLTCKFKNEELCEKWHKMNGIQESVFSQQCSSGIIKFIEEEISKLNTKSEKLSKLITEANQSINKLASEPDTELLSNASEQRISQQLINRRTPAKNIPQRPQRISQIQSNEKQATSSSETTQAKNLPRKVIPTTSSSELKEEVQVVSENNAKSNPFLVFQKSSSRNIFLEHNNQNPVNLFGKI